MDWERRQSTVQRQVETAQFNRSSILLSDAATRRPEMAAWSADNEACPRPRAQIARRLALIGFIASRTLCRAKVLDALRKFGQWTVEIVKRSDQAIGFEPLPRRWVVERTLAWLNRYRRLAKDFEASIASAKAWLLIASVQLLMRRVACSGCNYSDT